MDQLTTSYTYVLVVVDLPFLIALLFNHGDRDLSINPFSSADDMTNILPHVY